jgi:cytochrome c551/c552
MSTKFFVSALFIFFCLALNAAPPIEDGKTIFTTRCASCHNVNKVLTGPALAGVHERHSIDWIINFVHSSQTMVKKGDKDAVALFEKFNKIPMPDHPDLSADNIKSIVDYVKSESKVGEEKAPFAKPEKLRPNYTPISLTNYSYFIGFLGAVGVLILALLFAVEASAYRRRKSENKV